jgi:hypothetical protein
MRRLTGISALALAAMAGGARADVTPQQAWDNLQSYMQRAGYDVAGTEALSGDTLTVSDVVFSISEPEENTDVSITMDVLVMTGRDDGTVSVDFPSPMPIRMQFADDDAAARARIDYTHENLSMTVSGTPDEMLWDYAADRLGFALVDLEATGADAPAQLAFEAGMGPVDGQSKVVTVDGVQQVTQSVSLNAVSFDVSAQDETGEDGMAMFSGALEGVRAEGDTTLPDQPVDMNDMQAALEAGFGGTGTLSHQGSRIAFSVTDAQGETDGTVTSASGSLGVSFTERGLRYETAGMETALDMTVPTLPFPVSARWAESGFDLLLPVKASEEPQDAAMGLTLAGFTMSEALWNIFDPAGVLPREPATLAVDLAAQVTPEVSLFDSQAMEALGVSGEAPGALERLTLETLQLEAAGASVTGEGAFTFDNSDLETFDGFPRPEGEIRLQLRGQNTLIDRLIQMGLLAEEDAMGARMMLGMFTVPGDAPDSATATIEINAQGHILANGQRIQ